MGTEPLHLLCNSSEPRCIGKPLSKLRLVKADNFRAEEKKKDIFRSFFAALEI